MTEQVRIFLHPKFCIVTTQSLEDALPGARRVFRALAPCPQLGMPDERSGMEVRLTREAVFLSRWHFDLPKKRLFVSREMLEG